MLGEVFRELTALHVYAYAKSYLPCPAVHVVCNKRAVDTKVSIDHNSEAHWASEHRLPGANSQGQSSHRTLCVQLNV